MARRAVVVGMGLMGEMHAREYLHMPGVELVGLVETDPGKHEALRARYQLPVLSSHESLVGDCDLASICTPDDRHADSAADFLNAGARVLVEKPLATSLDDAHRIVGAARSPDVLAVGHVLRFDPRVVRCRELIQAGTVGDILQVQVWRKTTRDVGDAPSRRTSVAWFLGVHDADLVRHITGLNAAEVAATGRRVFSEYLDIAYAHIQYDNGALGTMDNCWTLPAGRANRALAGLRVVGSDASVELDLGHVDLRLATASGCVNVDTRFWPGDTTPGYWNLRGELQAFAGEEGRDAALLARGHDGLAAVAVVDAIHRSVASEGARQRPYASPEMVELGS